jgi:hypothetical protein
VLDPKAAEQTILELEGEITRAQSLLRGLLARETAIAAELQALASHDG